MSSTTTRLSGLTGLRGPETPGEVEDAKSQLPTWAQTGTTVVTGGEAGALLGGASTGGIMGAAAGGILGKSAGAAAVVGVSAFCATSLVSTVAAAVAACRR